MSGELYTISGQCSGFVIRENATVSKRLASLEKGSDIKSSSFLPGSSSSCLPMRRVGIDRYSMMCFVLSSCAPSTGQSTYSVPPSEELKRKTLYREQTRVETK